MLQNSISILICTPIFGKHYSPPSPSLISLLVDSSGTSAGTGYLTACFAIMVGPQGRSVGVEHIPELVASSVENIKKSAAAELMRAGSLSLHASGMFLPEYAPTLQVS